jgi:cyclophilin family peptidyl-prolyl cis-trans isomerase
MLALQLLTNTENKLQSRDELGSQDKMSNNGESENQKNMSAEESSNQKEKTMSGVDKTMKFATLNIEGYGDIKLELYADEAPLAVENFQKLISSGYYNNVVFHRIIDGFMIQGGDPTGTGRGGESAFGGEFKVELNPGSAIYQRGYKKGVLAMANRSNPNSNGSQFFIMLADYPLPKDYTIFGNVVAGQDVVDKLGKIAPTPGTDSPSKKPVIKSAKLSVQ